MSAADRQLMRATGSMAGGTIVSRITGMVRNTMLIAAIGTGMFADTFTLGNTLPNVVYILIIGGALNAVFIPELVRHMKDDGDEATAYADRLITLAGVGAARRLRVGAVLLAPWIVRLYATSEYAPTQLDLAMAFARFCLPQIFFYGVYTMLSQVLNARGHFGCADVRARCVNNVVAIATSCSFIAVALVAEPPTASDADARPARAARASAPPSASSRRRWCSSRCCAGPATATAPASTGAAPASAPPADWPRGPSLFVLVNQLAYVVIVRLATTAGNAAADRGRRTAAGLTVVHATPHLIFLLPHSVITVSLVAALLPRMSRDAHLGALNLVRRDVARGVNLATAAMVPAAALLVLLGPRIGVLLFNYGNSTFEDARYLGLVVSFFALGLPAFSAYYVLLRGYYAQEDTRTPFTINVGLNLVNVALALAITAALPPDQQVAGLAVAYSVAYWLALGVSWLVLRRRLGGLETYLVVRTAVRVSIATGIALAIGFGLVASGLVADGSQLTPLTALVSTAVIGSVFAAAYLLVARRLRVRELDVIVDPVLRRLRRR